MRGGRQATGHLRPPRGLSWGVLWRSCTCTVPWASCTRTPSSPTMAVCWLAGHLSSEPPSAAAR